MQWINNVGTLLLREKNSDWMLLDGPRLSSAPPIKDTVYIHTHTHLSDYTCLSYSLETLTSRCEEVNARDTNASVSACDMCLFLRRHARHLLRPSSGDNGLNNGTEHMSPCITLQMTTIKDMPTDNEAKQKGKRSHLSQDASLPSPGRTHQDSSN